MDELRYAIALVLLLVMPGVYLYWLLIHPWVRFWRRLGVRRTLLIVYAPIVAQAALLFKYRKALLSVEWGTDWRLVAAAAPLLLVSGVLRRRLGARFSAGMLLGLPELAPGRKSVPLVTDGIYARMRHPRYVQILVALAGYALVANYLVLYVLLALGLPWLAVVVRLEERELRERFGADWEAYAARVPRFLPRCGRRAVT